ncbi:hypothetical protein HJG53_17150 [Sphingomonas sp. ID1715]|uniref:hypothetical protein n=1 Tax=Sphingomonas sp. ID1715 TaxID=1656898 RepID=UPI001487D566|nr:hypothetical protein [Sphingomonas sp. ID1715]NNM78618.1 hypothetical protein [Sphingomonas sp. ID1715]
MRLGKLKLLLGAVLLSTTVSAHARGVVVDDGLNPNILRFGLETLSGSVCDASQCQILLPYSVDFGGGFTNKLFLYSSGIISAGSPLPQDAFASAPVNSNGDPVDIPTYFGQANHVILAPGYRPDDAGTPANLNGVGTVTSNTIRQFATGSIRSCTVGNSNPSFTTCPDGFDPNDFDIDATPFIDPFIAINGLGRFEGDINLRVGLQYVVLHKPAGGFVDMEFFQDDNFFEETDPVYVGLANNLSLYDLGEAKQTPFSYRFAVNAGVPEPQSWAAMLLGFALMGCYARKRDRTQASLPA